jgi:hypothetical protein
MLAFKDFMLIRVLNPLKGLRLVTNMIVKKVCTSLSRLPVGIKVTHYDMFPVEPLLEIWTFA